MGELHGGFERYRTLLPVMLCWGLSAAVMKSCTVRNCMRWSRMMRQCKWRALRIMQIAILA